MRAEATFVVSILAAVVLGCATAPAPTPPGWSVTFPALDGADHAPALVCTREDSKLKLDCYELRQFLKALIAAERERQIQAANPVTE